jgi:hypothetical protein
MRLLDTLRRKDESRNSTAYSFDDLLAMFAFNGNTYYGAASPLKAPSSPVAQNFAGYTGGIYNQSGVVAAAIVARALLMSQLRFQWRSTLAGENGKLFGTAALAPLERPGDLTRAELLFTAEQHNSLAGNAFFFLNGGQIRLLRPDWVTIVYGSNTDSEDPTSALDAELLGYSYRPGGSGSQKEPVFLTPSQVAHWKPEPDPVFWWRGQSWIGSVMAEIQTDRQATMFKSKFFENSATPQLIVTLDAQTTQTQAEDIAKSISRGHEGASSAYKTLVLGGGADVTVAGSNLGQLDLKNTQGLDETRIALRSRVPATILGISEGLAGSALNAGNYSQTRRLWADAWFTPTAQNLCGSLERILTLPPGRTAELSFDPSQIEFLQEDRRDEADIRGQKASTMRQLIEAGFVPSTVTQYVATGDESVLQHTGNVSVQLQPAGTTGAV